MDAKCQIDSHAEFGDMAELFEFVEASEYYDGPIAGVVRCRDCGVLFQYRCVPIIVDVLWHWTLVPRVTDVTDIPMSATEDTWISIVEDRRIPGSAMCRLVLMSNGVAEPNLKD